MPTPPTYPGVYIEEVPSGPRTISGVATSITAFVGFTRRGPVNEPTRVPNFAEFARIFGGLWEQSTMSYAVQHYFANGGREAIVVRAANGADGEMAVTDLVPASPDGTGVYALDKADLFNLLCIPPPARGGDMTPAALGAASAYCADRRALLIVDPHSTWDEPADIISGANALSTYSGLRRENSAIYFPAIRVADPLLGGAVESFPSCGAVAGIMARTDAERGVWKAPAGEEASLTGVQGLSVTLTDRENGQLNPLGVNCLRTFPVIGNVVWGARTMDGADALASEWKYIPVRRLALFLEESLYRGTQWVVFEPNDEPLWSQICLNAGNFMQKLFLQGAFQGATPRDAYFVKCDQETTTQNDIDLGIVNILVGFAPLKPAEFVIIRIQQLAGQVA